jgi:hypothetical protein
VLKRSATRCRARGAAMGRQDDQLSLEERWKVRRR